MIKKLLCLATLFCLSAALLLAKDPKLAVVIPSYNNERWVTKNLESIANQTYDNFHIYYINDCSKDKTGQLVDQFVASHNLTNKFTVIHNKERVGALANLYAIISRIAPDTVIATVDGDDWLKHKRVLERVAKEYRNPYVWMTYGNYITEPASWGSCCDKIPSKVAKKNTFRSYKWVSTHLRTFYAKLFQLIKKEDLMYNGDFYPMTWDLAFMFPCLEMSAKGHFLFIRDDLYVYNVTNPIRDYSTDAKFQHDLDKHIRAQKPYKPLKKLF